MYEDSKYNPKVNYVGPFMIATTCCQSSNFSIDIPYESTETELLNSQNLIKYSVESDNTM